MPEPVLDIATLNLMDVHCPICHAWLTSCAGAARVRCRQCKALYLYLPSAHPVQIFALNREGVACQVVKVTVR